MKLPRMSVHIGDYLRDTSHLDAAQSGAYIHLIMHYWATGGLPNDDKQLGRIAKMTARQWTKNRSVIAALFAPNWRHKRVDEEMRQAIEKYEKRAAAGKKGGEQKASNARVSLEADANQPLTLTPNKKEEGDGEQGRPQTLQRRAGQLANKLAVIAGIDPNFFPPGWCGAPQRIEVWLQKDGWTEEIIEASVRQQMGNKHDGAPDGVGYFEKGIARMVARVNAPLPEVKQIDAPKIFEFNGREKKNGFVQAPNGSRHHANGKQPSLAELCFAAAAAIDERAANPVGSPDERSDVRERGSPSDWGDVIDVSQCEATGSWGLRGEDEGRAAKVPA